MPALNASWREYLDEKMLPHMWCPGCGNGIALGALTRALAELALPRNRVVVVTGIGCWGKADDYLATSALHGTHGRALAFATGVKAARPELTVIVLMGDGDGATIGGNHLIHAARRNIDLTAVVLNNQNYGMTGGQVSATTPVDAITSTTMYGNPERDFDLCRLVDAAGANYVARGGLPETCPCVQMGLDACVGDFRTSISSYREYHRFRTAVCILRIWNGLTEIRRYGWENELTVLLLR